MNKKVIFYIIEIFRNIIKALYNINTDMYEESLYQASTHLDKLEELMSDQENIEE